MAQLFADLTHLSTLSLPAAALSGISDADKLVALQAASDEAASYLRSVYTLPLTEWDLALRRHVAAMAAFILMGVKGYKASLEANDIIRQVREDAVSWLKQVASGRVTPGYTDSRSASPTAPRNVPIILQPRTEYGQRVVGRPKRRGW